MAEPALRKLDRDLPRLDPYAPHFRARLSKARAKPEPKPETPAHGANRILKQANELLALAAADRAAAAEALSDARAHAACIIAEAETKARVALAVGPELPSVASIQKAVADRFGIGISALLGAGTAKHLVAARYEAIRQAHAARPDLSSLTLGRLFRRDHSIILRVIKTGGAK